MQELEKGLRQIGEEGSFVAWRLPMQKAVTGYLQYSQPMLLPVDFKEEAFIFSPFNNTDGKVLTIKPDNIYKNGKWATPLDNTIDLKWQVTDTAQSGNKEDYINLVQAGIDAIKADEFKKVVLCRSEENPLSSGFGPIIFFKKLCDAYPNAFVYLLSSKTTGTWLGATPELLMRKDQRSVTTVALAGTRKLNQAEAWGEKEIMEHKWVEDYVEEVIGKYTSLKIKKSGSEVEAGHLAHIFKKLEAEEVTGAEKALMDLHPTPAVGGLPKQKAIDFINTHEGFDRQFYAGFLGAVGNEDAAVYVNLRCMQLQETTAMLYAGAGIVEDSIPEKEWEETVQKMETLRKLF